MKLPLFESVAPVIVAVPAAPVTRSVPLLVRVPLLSVPARHCQLPASVPPEDDQLPPSSVPPTPTPVTVPAKLPPPTKLTSRPALTSTVAPLVKLTGTSEAIAAAVPAVLVSVPALLMLPPPVEEVMPISDCRSNVAPAALLRMPEVLM